MNVLVIPEDFRKDQFILDPILKAMMQSLGKPFKLEICRDPLLGGISHALSLKNNREIVESRPMIDLFILCVDRDGDPHRRAALDHLEHSIQSSLRPRQRYISTDAWQELEVWVLAGHDLPVAWKWSAIRSDRDPKESYFMPFARQRNLENEDDNGRKQLSREAAKRYRRLRHRCPNDILYLEGRISE